MNLALLSFGVTMMLFVVVGLWAMQYAKKSSEDYLTTQSTTPPWLAGLSAVATNNSGYMFIGMIGYTPDLTQKALHPIDESPKIGEALDFLVL